MQLYHRCGKAQRAKGRTWLFDWMMLYQQVATTGGRIRSEFRRMEALVESREITLCIHQSNAGWLVVVVVMSGWLWPCEFKGKAGTRKEKKQTVRVQLPQNLCSSEFFIFI